MWPLALEIASAAMAREFAMLCALFARISLWKFKLSRTSSSVSNRCCANRSLAASWHSFFSALPARRNSLTCAGSSDAAYRNNGGCVASTVDRNLSVSLVSVVIRSWSCSWNPSSASMSGAVRQHSFKASGCVSGGGAVASAPMAMDERRPKFFASMKEISQA